MPGFDGTGPMGMGAMTGGGRGFCHPRGGSLRYSRPRWAPSTYPGYGAYDFRTFVPRMSREQEIEFLKNQAEALKDELKELENEIGKISAEKKE